MSISVNINTKGGQQRVLGLLAAALTLTLSGGVVAKAAEQPTGPTVANSSTGNEGRVAVCHVSPLTDRGSRTRYVSPKSVQRHLDHGDYLGPCAVYRDQTTLGDGLARTYAQINEDDTPYAIGVEFSESLFTNLPVDPPADGYNCWDADGDGEYSHDHGNEECVGGHSRVLFLPRQLKNTPFQWVLLNWNKDGHGPEGVYSFPHFDFHFYILDYVDRNYIRPGPCDRLMHCDDLQRALKPLPPELMPEGYTNVGSAEMRMGNHLVDLSSPEFQGGQFTHTFIYGSYDGRIAFWEPMITLAYLQSTPQQCTPIKQAAAFETSGYYPTVYCVSHQPDTRRFKVSMEGFEYRQAP